MKYGEKLRVEIDEIVDGVQVAVMNVPEGITVTALDFGKALAQRKVEGYSPNPEEEIDVISGIKNEMTTGEDIVFEYIKGTKISGMILAGVIAKKVLKKNIYVYPIEVGGISTDEKNSAYIKIAVQKMIETEDAMGSVTEVNLPFDIEIEKFKGDFAGLAFSLIPEIEAVQYGVGIKASKKTAQTIGAQPKRAEVTFAPHLEKKIPALALSYSIVLESLASTVLANI